jgi:drug/metabolite transporter (DMT)-like permease
LMSGPSLMHATASLSLLDWSLLAYLSIICTVAGYALWFAAIRETQVNAAALTIFVQPVAGPAIAMALLGESLHWGEIWGALLIGVALIIGLSPKKVFAST